VGLFQHKQDANKKSRSPIVEVYEDEKNFFDESFRDEIKEHARSYFEEIIKENVVIFKQDLDAAVAEISAELKTHTLEKLDETIGKVNGELKEHALKQIDQKFADYGKEMKEAQTATLESLSHSANDLQEQYKQLGETVKKSIEDQQSTFTTRAEENKQRFEAMKQSQDSALELLNSSAQTLQEQYQNLRNMLQKNVVDQQNMLITAFQDNMAQIIEHYLLGSLGDQFDLKAQLPSIIKQMEADKDAIIGDMKL
jgi:predicted phage tail protein